MYNPVMPPRLLPLVCIAALAWACASGGGDAVLYETGTKAAVTEDGLHRVRDYRTDVLYAKPGADLGAYTGFIVAPVQLSYVASKAGSVVNEFSPSERERFEQLARADIEEAFGSDAALEPAEAAGPGVLLVRAELVDLALGVPTRPGPDDLNVMTTTEFRLYLDLSDSLTGTSLLRTVDARRVNPPSLGYPLTTGTRVRPSATEVTKLEQSASLRRAVNNRVRAFFEAFERLRAAGELPQPASRAARPSAPSES